MAACLRYSRILAQGPVGLHDLAVEVCPSSSATWATPTPFSRASVTKEWQYVYDTTPFRCGSLARRFRKRQRMAFRVQGFPRLFRKSGPVG